MSDQAATEVAKETKEEVKEAAVEIPSPIITSVKPIQMEDQSIVMFYNAELVNAQTIAFIKAFLEMETNFTTGCHAVLFRNDGAPYEYDAEANEPISCLGSYAHDALTAVINLEGIWDKASGDIVDGVSCESLPTAIYHLVMRTAIHEILHGSEYIVTRDKWAWQHNPGEKHIEELAMLHLIEMAKKSPELIELPDFATSTSWIDTKINGSVNEMRTSEGKKDDWEINQLYMIDNGKVFRSDDEEFSSMREYYRSMAEDQDDASWTIEEEIPDEPSPADTATTDSPEAILGRALLTGDIAQVMSLMSTMQTNDPPVVSVTPEIMDAGAAMPVEEMMQVIDPGVQTAGGADTSLLQQMMANTASFAPAPLSAEEQTIRNIFDLLFNEMFNKCSFTQGHWITPMAILDPIVISIPGAETVIHSFDYTNGEGAYVKGELFGGTIKGQLDTREGKHSRPAYVLHLKVGGQMVTRRLQPPYVLAENGVPITCPAGKDPAMWQQTSLTYQAQQGKQIGLLRDPVNQKNVYTLTRNASSGAVEWKAWK